MKETKCIECGEPEDDDIHSTYGRHMFVATAPVDEVEQERQRWLTWYVRHQSDCVCDTCTYIRNIVSAEEARTA